MKILFVYKSYESIGIEILSSYLKKNGHQVELIYLPYLFNDGFMKMPTLSKIFSHNDYFINKIIKSEPDIVAFSSNTDTYKDDILLAALIKQKSDLKIIFGGIHPTVCPETVLESGVVDYVCVGEGEKPLLKFASEFSENNPFPDVPGIWFKNKNKLHNPAPFPLIKNLDNLPFPDKSLFYNKAPYFKDYYTIIASRGCPGNCYYCNNNAYRKIYPGQNIFRLRSVENVIKELETGLKKYSFKYVIFSNDTFSAGHLWTNKLLNLYIKKINKPFICYIDPATLTVEQARLLKKAGCRNVGIGIQTLQPDIRKNVLNRPGNIKNTLRGINRLKKNGIPFTIDHIANIPGENIKQTVKYLKTYINFRPERINYFYLTYYPGTELFYKKQKEGKNSNMICEKIKKGETPGYNHGYFYWSKRKKVMKKLGTLAHWGYLFPSVFTKIIDYKLVKYMPENDFFSRVIPSFLCIFIKRAKFGQWILKKYVYHFLRGGF
ncbi:MAG: B12-binding domain-containing radical SAM protein [Candidatus Muiribacteriota bacterium]